MFFSFCKNSSGLSSFLRSLFMLSLAILMLVSLVAQASSYCNSPQAYLQHNIGFMLSKNGLQILQADKTLAKNKNVSLEKRVERIIAHMKKYRASISGISNEDLAQLIVKASSIVGVDFTYIASIIRKESMYCKARFNKTGGDSGCVQLTTSGLKEVKHQLGLEGSKKHSPGVPAILKAYIAEFFKDQPEREAAYHRWVALDCSTQKASLRGTSNYDFDILTGTLLFKIYLSTNNGQYVPALRQYNGSKKKVAYANDVNAVALRVHFNQEQCLINEYEVQELLDTACDIGNNGACDLEEETEPQRPRAIDPRWT